MIVAPAGYGKTTLLAEWAMRDPRPFAWLSVEALRRAGDGAVASLAGLVEDVGACLTPHVIVLDDTHHLASDLAMRRVTDLACRLPAGSCVARRVAPAARGSARPASRASSARASSPRASLAMTRLEAAMLLDTAGVRLEAGQLDRLVALTEGWPVGLYLAALSIREQGGSQEAITQLGGAIGWSPTTSVTRCSAIWPSTSSRSCAGRRSSGEYPRPCATRCWKPRDAAAVLARLTRGDIPIEPVDRSDLAVSVQPALGGDAPRRPHPR